MKAKCKGFFSGCLVSGMIFLYSASWAGIAEPPVPRPEIAPYVEFLKNNSQDPVEYMLSLFDKYQIVVFVEGVHTESVQYEFLTRLISHPDFAGKVRGIFTEVGSITQQPLMDRFMASKTYDRDLLLKVYREPTVWPGWPSSDIIDFWTTLWIVNSRLCDSEKIEAWPDGMPWNWENLKTNRDYKLQELITRFAYDRIMAGQIFDKLMNLSYKTNKKDRFLVIMNTRHAVGLFMDKELSGGKSYAESTCAILKLLMPGKVANVLWNSTRAFVKNSGEIPKNCCLVANGLWDAAFSCNGNRPAGFTLKDTPFGNTALDYHAAFLGENYAQGFDGLVFYRPISDYAVCGSAPGYFDDEAYVEEFKRRFDVMQMQCPDIADIASTLETPLYDENEQKYLKKQIDQHLVNP
ncbi:MAG: hypothetical protein PHW04_03925 [Candidatus Wallbacteria bacterium]|nr:hypothetical protein [Candidatus Wallbacteria bacterium]